MAEGDDLAEYHRDPCGWCVRELRNPDPEVRCNAGDILRGLAFDPVILKPTSGGPSGAMPLPPS
jgi:hypothetical protein